MVTSFCPEHDCPLVQAGDEIVCLWEQADALVGHVIRDLIVEDGLTVLLFENGQALPMVGWRGNARAADPESADALLDVMDENYLVAAEPDERSIALHIADHPGSIEDGQWLLELKW